MDRLFKPLAVAVMAGVCSLTAGAAFGQSKEIRIAHVYDKTGPLEAYAKQTQTGLMMGLEYATGGKMEILGRKLVVIEKDSQGKPDVGKAQLGAAYGDDKVDIAVGPTSSGVALAMLPVAEEYKKVLLVEPAVADSHDGLGGALGMQGKFAEAVKAHRQATQLQPKDPRLGYNLRCSERRLALAVEELKEKDSYDLVVTNDRVSDTVGTLVKAFRERHLL